MCGIAGYLRTDGGPANAAIVKAMTDRLRTRGPDGEGTYVWKNVALGHRRLAIIDPAGGYQPLANEDGTVWVSFNGEIYNFQELFETLRGRGHQFRTRCDTEAIVHAYEEWGVDCLQHFRGMFGFAIWDEKRQRLFLARDRVGIKPLHYYQDQERFAFASEMQAFESLPDYQLALDLEALDLYLHLQYVPAPYSIYQQVRKLPPAHYLLVEKDGRTTGPTRYWELAFRPDTRRSEQEWLEKLHGALRDTIKSHLISDVPFGAFLSGGVDSSTVVAYVSELLEQPVKTFSIAFGHEDFDESPHARAVAAQFGTEHYEERVDPDHLGVLPELVEHYGEPFADSSALPTYYVSRLAAKHVKMVLSGDGGDENFAGYNSYKNVLSSRRRRHPEGFYRTLRHAIANVARVAGIWPRLPAPRPLRDVWFDHVAYFPERDRAGLWRPEFQRYVPTSRLWFSKVYDRLAQSDPCTHLQNIDLRHYLPDDILTKVDVASMCHGLEVRVPLLDHVFMEQVATIPSRFKLHAGTTKNGANGQVGKYLLKKNGERFFSRDFLHRKKQGFSVPVGEWFRGPLRAEIEGRLTERSSPMLDYLNVEAVRALLGEHDRTGEHGFRLWALLFLDAWLRRQPSRGQREQPMVSQAQPGRDLVTAGQA